MTDTEQERLPCRTCKGTGRTDREQRSSADGTCLDCDGHGKDYQCLVAPPDVLSFKESTARIVTLEAHLALAEKVVDLARTWCDRSRFTLTGDGIGNDTARAVAAYDKAKG